MDNTSKTNGKITGCETVTETSRNINANVRISAEENAVLMNMVKKSGLSKSEFLRRRVFSEVDNVVFIDIGKLLGGLAEVTVALNEIARILRSFNSSHIESIGVIRMRFKDVSQRQTDLELQIAEIVNYIDGKEENNDTEIDSY